METERETNPRAWVGCLECYNSGKLVGAWLDADEAADPLLGGLAREYDDKSVGCVVCCSEEFWCFDVEGLGSQSGEMSPSEFAQMVDNESRIDDHPNSDALRVFIAEFHSGHFSDFDAVVSEFEEAFVGEWSDEKEFAEESAYECGELGNIPEYILACIDWGQVWERYLRFDFWEEGGYFFRNL